MKNTTMRILAVMLLVCMLLSALPFATLAADYTYDANALYKAFTDAESRSNGASVSNKYLPDYFQVKFQKADNTIFFALLLENIADGTYTAEFNFTGKTNSGANIYVVPKSEATASVLSSSAQRIDLLNSKTPATFNSLGGEGTATLNLTFSGDADKDYVLIFTPALPDGQANGFVRIGDLKLTKGASAPKPTEPKPTTPKPTEPKPTEPKPTEPAPTTPATEPSTTPATEPSTTPATEPSTTPATTPSTNAGADNGSFPVAAIVAIVVVVLGGAAAGVYFFLKKKKAA